MRFRSMLLLVCSGLFLSAPAFAQKKIFATVNPNAEALNGVAEIFDPATGAITPSGSMSIAREQHVAVRLNNGKVLVAGGYDNRYLNSMELYSPADGSFTATTSLSATRAGAGVVLLRGGVVLIVGGYNGTYLQTAETFDPTSESVKYTGNMIETRYRPTVTLVKNGGVLVSGGFNGQFLKSVEVYDPPSAKFSSIGVMIAAREGHTATFLNDNNVLFTGGCNNSESDRVVCDNYLDAAEIWDSSGNIFKLTAGKMIAARYGHTATMLPDGKVLIVGGKNASSVLSSAEIYDPATGKFTLAAEMGTPRYGHTATLLPDGRVLIAGGQDSTSALSSAEIYSQGAFAPVALPMSAARYQHTATALADGKILLAGGENSPLLNFDVNFQSTSDDISPNIVFSNDSKVGFVSYTGSGVVLAFSAETGAVLKKIVTGGKPVSITPVPDGNTLAVVSALDNKIFIIRMDSLSLQATHSFSGEFGFGSILSLSPDGSLGYISSTSTGEVIKFQMSNGAELGRLTGLKGPAQITVTKDGATILVVDTVSNQLLFVDAASMTTKFTVSPSQSYLWTSFTIFNKAVLNADETYGVIGSQDYYDTNVNAVFVFNATTGEIVQTYQIGYKPGYTTLTPDGSQWLILTNSGLSFVLASDLEDDDLNDDDDVEYGIMPIYSGTPLGSSNVVTSADSKYAYYASATADLLFEQDLATKGAVGAVRVGDSANASAEHASSIALTPNAKTIAVLNFISNELDLLSDIYVFKQTKFMSQTDNFTGLSLVNLSAAPVSVKVTALNNLGTPFVGLDLPNPAVLTLNPNEQKSVDLSQLFSFDNATENSGRLVIESDEPSIVAFTATGQVHVDFLSAYTSGLQAIPFNPDYRKQLHDFIIPEIPVEDAAGAEFSFVNPTFSPSVYDMIHYGADGGVISEKNDQTLSAAAREMKPLSDVISAGLRGKVLLVGGFDGTSVHTTADLYQDKQFTASGEMSRARRGQSATLLLTGNVLVAGGKQDATIYRTAELYNASAGSFAKTGGTMSSERYRHTATLLENGSVLIAGGQDAKSISDTAEVFDPFTSGFSPVGAMTSPRDGHTATLLKSGEVLLAGGIDGISIAASAELYDPATSSFRAVGAMTEGRVFHTAVLLNNGKVLIAGGQNGGDYLGSAEIYDPATETFTAALPMNEARSGHTATLMPDGKVVIIGGANSSGALATVEIFDPDQMRFLTGNGSLTFARVWHSATLIPDTMDDFQLKILVAGGVNAENGVLNNGEFYDPRTQLFSVVNGTMNASRQNHAAVALRSGAQGYLRVRSDVGLLLTETFSHGGGRASLNGIDMEKYAGVVKIYSPQFKFSDDCETHINIINGNQENAARVTLTLFSADGAVLGAPVTYTIPKNGQATGNLWSVFGEDPALLNRQGWLEISSNVDKVVGTVSFTNSDMDFLTAAELSGVPMSRFIFPLVSEDSLYETEISLLNSGIGAASVRLELWGLSGTMEASSTLTLQPGALKSEKISNIFPGIAPFRTANLRVVSDQPLHGLALLSDRQVRMLSALPPIAYPEQ